MDAETLEFLERLTIAIHNSHPLTRRDYFAGQAMLMMDSYVKNRWVNGIDPEESCYPDFAKQCFTLADCMIDESKKKYDNRT